MNYLYLFLFLYTISCTTQPTEHYKSQTDWEMNSIKGKAKKVVKELYDAGIDSASGEIIKGEIETVYEYLFNEKGYLREFNEFVPAQGFSQHYRYDGKGYVQSFFRVELGDTLRDKCSLVVNDKGWVIEEIWLENGSDIQMRYVNTHNENGDIIATSAYEPGKESPQLMQEYDLDENGRRINIRYFDSQHELRQSNDQKFNEDGELRELLVRRQIGENWVAKMHRYFYYDYDAQGNWKKQIAHYNVGEDSVNLRYKWTDRRIEYYP